MDCGVYQQWAAMLCQLGDTHFSLVSTAQKDGGVGVATQREISHSAATPTLSDMPKDASLQSLGRVAWPA
jgi:hypothetical protein|eukprot:4548684-Prymnesium_polylepis.2